MADQTLYTPLDASRQQIRLLCISCSEFDDDYAPVRCSLLTATLDDPTLKYIALSYVWGLEMSHVPVVINGTDFRATANLFDFLVRYRKISYVVPQWELANMPLWIDAVCINQDDIPERNSQVQMMGSIYKSAERTVSWLGPDNGDSENSMKIMRDIFPKVNDSMRRKDFLAWLDPKKTSLWQKNEHHTDTTSMSSGNRFWDSCREILRRAYFSRSWITQELVLSRNVVVLCGQQTLPLYAFWVVWEWLLRIEGLPCPEGVDAGLWSLLSSREGRRLLGWGALSKLPNLMGLMKGSKDAPVEDLPLIWHDLVLHTRIQQATDPRDKLYSVLGILDRNFKPDYSASIEDVFFDFTKKFIRAEKRLSVLREAGHGAFSDTPEHPRHRLFVPSWVQNWDALSKEFTWGQFYHGQYRLFADGNPPLRLHQVGEPHAGLLSENREEHNFKIVGRTLKARGVLCDTIFAVRRLGIDHESWTSFCEDYVSSRGAHSHYASGIPVLQALTRMMFLDQDPISKKDLDNSTPSRNLLRLCILGIIVMGSPAESIIEKFGLTPHSNLVEKFLGSEDLTSHVRDFEEVTKDLIDMSTLRVHLPKLTSDRLSLLMNYVAFWTNEGYLGWGPQGMVNGDIVCIIIGCEVPVVLRRVADHYIHMGPCWVLGLMSGEAIAKAVNGLLVLSGFDII